MQQFYWFQLSTIATLKFHYKDGELLSIDTLRSPSRRS
jgi:hypothetical protein